MTDAVILLSDGANGIYIPKFFAEQIDRSKLSNVSDDDLAILKQEPDSTEGYWDTWCDVLDNAVLTTSEGETYTLMQDGDLWAIDLSRMTAEEKANFGIEEE